MEVKGIEEALEKNEKFIQNANPLRRGYVCLCVCHVPDAKIKFWHHRGRQGNDMVGPSEAELIRELGLEEQDKVSKRENSKNR